MGEIHNNTMQMKQSMKKNMKKNHANRKYKNEIQTEAFEEIARILLKILFLRLTIFPSCFQYFKIRLNKLCFK